MTPTPITLAMGWVLLLEVTIDAKDDGRVSRFRRLIVTRQDGRRHVARGRRRGGQGTVSRTNSAAWLGSLELWWMRQVDRSRIAERKPEQFGESCRHERDSDQRIQNGRTEPNRQDRPVQVGARPNPVDEHPDKRGGNDCEGGQDDVNHSPSGATLILGQSVESLRHLELACFAIVHAVILLATASAASVFSIERDAFTRDWWNSQFRFGFLDGSFF
jgi:hypothetical protein